jgi:hypothetical protein
MTTTTSIATILYGKTIELIKLELTLGIQDILEPFSDIQINQFIEDYKKNIELTINSMITDYEKDGKLEELNNPDYEMISEYLHKFVPFENVMPDVCVYPPEIAEKLRDTIIQIIKDVVTIDIQKSKYGINSDTIQIDKYIELSKYSIEDAIEQIILHHQIDRELDSLYNPDYDMVYQYLFDSSEVF